VRTERLPRFVVVNWNINCSHFVTVVLVLVTIMVTVTGFYASGSEKRSSLWDGAEQPAWRVHVIAMWSIFIPFIFQSWTLGIPRTEKQ